MGVNDEYVASLPHSFRESSKRKKGKQKRDKKNTKPVDEGGKLANAPSELSGKDIRENIATRTEAYQLLQVFISPRRSGFVEKIHPS